MDDYTIWIRFEDGFEGAVYLKSLLSKGIGIELLNAGAFAKVSIASGGGLTWENGFDICLNSLREIAEAKLHAA